jgi:hypothetical protein
MRRISSLVLVLVAGLFATGCATTVRPQARPIDPVPVFLTDYGVHSSLMLPTADGNYVEYSFGDYGYAALNHGGPHNALGALLVSGQSAIGRRFLSVRPGDDAPRPAYAPKSFQKFYAERFQVSTLVKELDERFSNGAEKSNPVHNPITDAVFVKDTEHYSIANNCNHMTARLLRELGCSIAGDPGRSAFQIIGKQEIPPAIDTSNTLAAMPQVPPQVRQPVRASVVPKPAPRPQPLTASAREPAFTKLDTE